MKKFVFVIITLLLVFNLLNVQEFNNDQSNNVQENIGSTDLEAYFFDPIRQQELLDAEITKLSEVLGGMAYGVQIVGSYAYVANEYYGLRIFNISDPTTPTKVGEVCDGGIAYDVFVSGSYAYVADFTDGLEIIDISDPTNPVEVGQHDDGAYSRGVVVNGSYAYVADGYNGLRIIDISDPTTPVEVGSVDDGGNARAVVVNGSYAYVADDNHGLEIINVSNPFSPEEVGEVYDGGNACDVVFNGSYVYVADRGDGLEIIDITDPTSPVEVGSVDDGGNAEGVVVNGSYAYVADGSNGLEVINVSNPFSPEEVGEVYDGGSALDISISGSYAYVADYTDGLEVIDISDLTTPVEVGQFNEGNDARKVQVVGSYVYVADGHNGLVIFNISDPTNPVEVGQFFDGGQAYDVFVSGSYAYVADYTDGLEVIDISDPTTPVEVGSVHDGGQAYAVVVNGSYAYVADAGDGLEIINVSNPFSPEEVGSVNDGGNAVDISINGSYAYVADAGDGLEIIDIGDPTTPVEVGQYDDGESTLGVYFNGSYAFIADYSDGLKIINVTDPINPEEVGRIADGGFARDVFVSGSYAYVADDNHGLEIIDVSDPTSPVEVGQFDDGGSAYGVFVNDSYIYVAERYHGLKVLEVVFADNVVPEISDINLSPSSPTDLETATITVNVTDISGLQSVTLSYRVDDGDWVNASMSIQSGTIYQVTIGSFDALSTIDYYIIAIDASFNHNVAIDDNTGSYYSFSVTDATSPSISNISHSPSIPTDEDQVTFTANVTDTSGIQSVTLHYQIDGGDWLTTTMALQEGITYEVTMSPFATFSDILYYVSAIDDSVNHYEATDDNSGIYYGFGVVESDHTIPSVTGIMNYPDYPSNTETVDITADVSDASGIQSVTLSYRVDAGTWTNVTMVLGSGSNYDATIGPFAAESTIDYFVTAVDDSPYHNIAINDNSGAYFSFGVFDGDFSIPLISDVSHTPTNPTDAEEVNITASVTDASGIQSVILSYRIDVGAWTNVTMALQSGSTYQVTIGPFATGSPIEYFIIAIDASFNLNEVINNNSGDLYSFSVSDSDFDLPLISDVSHSPSSPTSADSVTITATVTDASGLQSVILSYRVDDGSWTNVTMTLQSGSTYQVTIGSFAAGSNISYYVIAIDDSQNHNTATDNNSGNLYKFSVVADSTGDPKDDDGGNGAIIIIVVVVVLAGAGAGVYFFMNKRKS